MARGKTLTELLEQLRAEIGHSVNPNIGLAMLEPLRNIIRRNYEWLYDDYDWSFLKVWRDKDLAAGQFLYDFPTDMNLERIEQVWTTNGGSQWVEITKNILEVSDYNSFDTSSDVRSSPMRKWRIYSGEQFEAWPIPATNVEKVKFVGIKEANELIDDDDTCDLDDRMITLFSAAEYLARQKMSDAKVKLELATERLSKMKKRTATKDRVVIGQSNRPYGNGMGNIRVIVGSQT